MAAHDEEDVIAAKVSDALGQDYPAGRLEVVVASDGSGDATVERARAAGAHLVLDLPRGGKVQAQDAAVARARHDLLAFSDANAAWAPDALRHLVAPFADPAIGYACGLVRFVGGDGTNQEGLYWRYETWVRGLESGLGGVTAGNGAIYAVRRTAYRPVDPRVSHDLSLPFALVKDGWRAVFEPRARAVEKMVPSVEGEWRRKRRMMAHAWPMVLGGALLDPRGYAPLYAFQVLSHRALRYASPLLHLVLAAVSLRAAAPRAHPARRPGRAPARRRTRPAAAAAAPAPGPLLRAHDGLGGRGAVGPPAGRDAGGLGARGGHALISGARRRTGAAPVRSGRWGVR